MNKNSGSLYNIKESEEYLTESCKDLATARKFASEVKELAKKYDANFYLVTDGASATNNDGTNDAVKYARDTMKKWETDHGFDAKEDWSIVKESYIFNGKDIIYNKDKFDSGEINLCFITGHSGSGKSTLAHSMENNNVDVVELDDVVWNKMKFSMSNMKEYGDMIYSFFTGVGKKYWYTEDDVKNGKVKPVGDDYENLIIKDFINYAKSYAKAHKNKKFVLEGVWLAYNNIEPSELKDYCVIIKGTSIVNSALRGIKRDHSDDDKPNLKRDIRALVKRSKYWKEDEEYMQKYRKYFSDLIKKQNKDINITESVVDESVSTALDKVISNAENKSSYNKDYKDMMKLDGIRSTNKTLDKVLKKSDKAVSKTLNALDKPASSVNNATNKAIHKTVGGGISFYNKFAKKKIEEDKKRDIEAKAGVGVKLAAFGATKIVPMGPIDWMLNLIAVTKVPTSDDPIDKEVQKVVNTAKDNLKLFRNDIKKYAADDKKYASAKDQLKDLERIEGKYEPITKKLALMMDNLNKKKESAAKPTFKPAYESSYNLDSIYEILDKELLNSSGTLLESSYDILYDFIYEEDYNDNLIIYNIVNHYLNK